MLNAWVLWLLLAARPAGAGDCPVFDRYTWKLDLRAKSVARVALTKAAAQICEFPKSGQENVRLELRKGSELLYQREVFLKRSVHFDAEGKGGRIPDEAPVLMAAVPRSIAAKDVVLQLKDLKSGALLAEGKP